MAYITAPEVREIRKELKKEFPKWKFSVRNRHHSAVQVDILKGTADFAKDMRPEDEYHQVNTYYINRHFERDNAKVLEKIKKIIKTAPAKAENGREWYDNTDAQIDYFDTAFYYYISIGRFEKPYEVI